MSVADQLPPVGGVDYPRTFQEFSAWFPDDRSCLDYLARLRWPTGFTCPSCSSTRAWYTAKSRWMCGNCGRQTSVTAGTIFHRLRTPLSAWFTAIWLITAQQQGISSSTLQNSLGFASDQTAGAWLQKLRPAMVRPDRDLLSGFVELDQVVLDRVFLDEPEAMLENTPILVAVESAPHQRLTGVRLGLAEIDRSLNLIGFAMRVIVEGSTVRTRSAIDAKRLVGLGYQRYTGPQAAEPPPTTLPGIQPVGSLLESWLAESLDMPVAADRLAYYLDELTFRLNNPDSKSGGLLFYRLLMQSVHNEPHPRAPRRKPQR